MPQNCCDINSSESRKIDLLARFVKMINEPNRLKILCLLKHGELCVCEIFETLNLPQNLISHHLKELSSLEIVSFRKEGTKVIYSRNELVIDKYSKLLNEVIQI
ncbi:MAG: metalloregulator ArsR/SmtB family transcription factor [Patescibacteria group bacterium]|jgi:ArsR family transcriptional regulator